MKIFAHAKLSFQMPCWQTKIDTDVTYILALYHMAAVLEILTWRTSSWKERTCSTAQMSFAIFWVLRYNELQVFVLPPPVRCAWTCMCHFLCPMHHKNLGYLITQPRG